MVGLYGPSHHQVGRVDEIARLGRRFVFGDLESVRACEVGGQVFGGGQPEDGFVSAGRAGVMAEGTGGDRLDRVGRCRRPIMQEMESVSG